MALSSTPARPPRRWLVLVAAVVVAAAVRGVSAQAPASHHATMAGYFAQSFYHMAVLPLLAATVVLAYWARPSTSDEFPKGFRRFQMVYLSVWTLCVAADWLQGPFVYALYAEYGFSGRQIAELFVAGFGSSLIFGCFVGTFCDKFGRKRSCLIYCVMYILSCMTKHFKQYSVLMLGRITGGIATSMLFSCFECWMVSEHLQRNNFSGGLLSYMFGLMFTVMYCVAIASGLAGQAVADAFPFVPISEGSVIYVGGKCGPFDLAIACLFVGMALIAAFFDENYGSDEGATGAPSPSLMDNIRSGVSLLSTDRRALLLGVVVSAFEGSMYAFVFNWTPALNSKQIPPPHGVIFALFMMSCMCGASVSTLAGAWVRPAGRLVATFAAGFFAFVLSTYAAMDTEEHVFTSFVAFLLFEFCVGVYFPSVGVMKSEIVPEQVRGTVYNLYRVPLNAIVVALLLSDITMATCFKLNALFLLVALISVLYISVNSGGLAGKAGKGGDEERPIIEGKADPVSRDLRSRRPALAEPSDQV